MIGSRSRAATWVPGRKKSCRRDSYLGMWRIRMEDGSLSDMVNRTRARDAARSILLGILNAQETASGGPPMRSAA